MSITAFPMQATGLLHTEAPVYNLLDHVVSAGIVNGLSVVQNPAGANMSATVTAGTAYVAITGGGKRQITVTVDSNSGAPGLLNTTDWLATFTAADATKPRIDRVVVVVQDSIVDGGSGFYRGMLKVVAGTATTGATLANLNGVAAVPANSLLLANVLIPAAGSTVTTANIDTTVAVVSKVGAGGIAAAGPQYVTAAQFGALTPTDGMEVFLIADATNGVVWRMRYNAASASAYKWEFVGGGDLFAEVQASESIGTNSYVDLTTVGPSIPTPRVGDYDIEVGAYGAGSGGARIYMAYAGGGITASDTDAASLYTPDDARASIARLRRKTGVTAATITAKYKCSTGTLSFSDRWMRIRPVRLG